MKNISRRDFLKGALASGATVAAGSLLTACATTSDETENSRNDGTDNPYTDHSYGSYLNPQQEYETDSGDYSAIFSSLTIGNVTMANRMMKSCAGSEMQKSTDWPSDTSLQYYKQFSDGGIGMVCYEPSNVTNPASGPDFGDMPAMGGAGPEITSAQMDISTDAGIEAHTEIARFMHEGEHLSLHRCRT